MNSSSPREWNSPEFQRRINNLRQTDNWTNWFYLLREYLFLFGVAGCVLAFYHYRPAWGLAWAWNVPVTLLAVVLIGVGQHRLIMLGHEASHYVLFRNRLLNELASDWLCMYPILSVTQNYRLQHLAHHQYVNDPDRDPDLHFMEASGQRCRLPLPGARLLWECVVRPLLWLPGLLRYVLVRARHTTMSDGPGPYQSRGPRSSLLIRVGGVYLLTLALGSQALAWWGDAWLLGGALLAWWAVAMTFYALVPTRLYPSTLVKPIISPRAWTLMRISYSTLIWAALSWMTYATGTNWALYYLTLWILPLVTVFAFLMTLREGLQHGGADRGRLTSSRVFLAGPLLRFAVFPLGMDYHLPHHLFPMVPHYRLRELHQLLMEDEGYRREAPVIGTLAQTARPHVVVPAGARSGAGEVAVSS
jgi:fatty acid desaturase